MRYQPIDALAFLIAFVSAPIVFTLMYFWILLIPVIAFVGGFIPYLIIGLPLLMWHLLFQEPDEDRLHMFTLKSVVTFGTLAMVLALVADRPEIFGFALYGTVFGVMIGPLWTVQFCRIYLKLQRPMTGNQRGAVPSESKSAKDKRSY